MAKHLRPIGESYTDFLDETEFVRLGRGLHRGHHGVQIPPTELPSYLAEYRKALMRQVVAVLDKVVGKRRRLSGMHPEAYRDRVHLAEALWVRLVARVKEIGTPPDPSELLDLRRMWNAKAHPYAEYDVVPRAPLNDGNGQKILECREVDDPKIERSDFEGRWHGRFWQSEPGPVDYNAIADRIFAHLFDQEAVIGGGPRREGNVTVPDEDINGQPGPATGKGLIIARGQSIVKSASDPRRSSKKVQRTWDKAVERRYFGDDGKGGSDIAKAIYEELGDPATLADPIYASWFGSRLYDHFGSFKNSLPLELKDPFKEQIWALHNSVRQFYQRMAKSDRFRLALQNARSEVPDRSELLALLPKDHDHLLLVLGGKKKNAEMSELIRLGKLFVHASDVLHDFDANDAAALDAFKRRMSFLATSIGQSEIKQTETFARTWRGAVGLTLRTVKGLADPRGIIGTPDNRDLGTAGPMKDAFNKFDQPHFQQHMTIIFGNKELQAEGNPTRSSVFTANGDKDHQAELLWGFLCVVRSVRNRTNHYNVRRALFRLLDEGIVSPMPSDPKKERVENRNLCTVSPTALEAFRRLLNFDLAIQKEAVRTALEQAKASEFVEEGKLRGLVSELAGTEDMPALHIPRFSAVMDKVRRLADNRDVGLDPILSTLQRSLPPTDKQAESDAARCRYRLLLELYKSGFRSWFSGIQSNEENNREICHWAVKQVGRAKDARKSEYDKKTKRHYRSPNSLIDDLGLDKFDDLTDLLEALASQSTREHDQNLKYVPDARVQSQMSNRIEEFRQELFAHIFTKYLDTHDFGWIGAIEVRREACDLADVVSAFEVRDQKFDADWHSQFYAWLYMVPPIEASRLRHQMRKSAVMDDKWSTTLELTSGDRKTRDDHAQDVLADMDRLFSLYTKVQAAGFNGQEHESALGSKSLFYEDGNQFDEVYSPDTETHNKTFPGTRRGLRQLVRYAHLPALEGVFKKHRITKAEVETFVALYDENRRDPGSVAHMLRREKLRTEILRSIHDGPKPKDKDFWPKLEAKCLEYRTVATETAIYNFQANAARLNDHARLHQIVMRVVARLTDYALIWERDRLFAFVGMLYRQTGGTGINPAMRHAEKTNAPPRIGILVSDSALAKKLNSNSAEVFIPYLDTETGFDAPRFDDLCTLLSHEHAKEFRFHFLEVGEENSKDEARRLNEETMGHRKRPAFKRGTRRQGIRNDLAHHNVLDLAGGAGPNLTYVVNAVRSLLSYDRKLKNAVPKSIKRILGEEGLIIEWQMNYDRLKKPTVYPNVETHLTMVPPRHMTAPVSFTLPRASVRLASMVKAVFDFGSSGYGEERMIGGRTAKQAVYPDDFTRRFPQTPMGLKQATRLVFASENS